MILISQSVHVCAWGGRERVCGGNVCCDRFFCNSDEAAVARINFFSRRACEVLFFEHSEFYRSYPRSKF